MFAMNADAGANQMLSWSANEWSKFFRTNTRLDLENKMVDGERGKGFGPKVAMNIANGLYNVTGSRATWLNNERECALEWIDLSYNDIGPEASKRFAGAVHATNHKIAFMRMEGCFNLHRFSVEQIELWVAETKRRVATAWKCNCPGLNSLHWRKSSADRARDWECGVAERFGEKALEVCPRCKKKAPQQEETFGGFEA